MRDMQGYGGERTGREDGERGRKGGRERRWRRRRDNRWVREQGRTEVAEEEDEGVRRNMEIQRLVISRQNHAPFIHRARTGSVSSCDSELEAVRLRLVQAGEAVTVM